MKAYDPAFGHEIAVIVEDGIRRMFVDREDCFYYLTVGNENYPQPALPGHLTPAAVKEGVLKGLYLYKPSGKKKSKLKAQLFGRSCHLLV